MISLVSAIFGGMDAKKRIPAQDMPYNYRFFDEGNLAVIPEDNLSNRNKALFFKTQGHLLTDDEILIWVDGKIQITTANFVRQCAELLGDDLIAMEAHPAGRECIYEEVNFIYDQISNGSQYLSIRYKNRPLLEQISVYGRKNYPKNNGLHDCCVIVRRNTKIMNDICDQWWQECKLDYYDQISIHFLCWLHDVKIKTIEFDPYPIKRVKHLKLQ